MTAITDTPTNLNFLSPLNFKFTLMRAPTVNFFIQSVNIPGMTLRSTEMPTPFIKVPVPGDHLNYDELEISFKVDEDLVNYFEIHNWIRALSHLKPSEYRALQYSPQYTGSSIRSDISLQILNSNRKPNYEITYKDAFPVSISSLEFDTKDEDVSFISATAKFEYINFDVRKVS